MGDVSRCEFAVFVAKPDLEAAGCDSQTAWRRLSFTYCAVAKIVRVQEIPAAAYENVTAAVEPRRERLFPTLLSYSHSSNQPEQKNDRQKQGSLYARR
jgi:hypothetical protein